MSNTVRFVKENLPFEFGTRIVHPKPSCAENPVTVQLVLRERAAALVQNYLTSRAMVEKYRSRMIPRAQKAYDLYVKNYAGMAAAYPQVLISQRTLFQLHADYIAALETLWGNSIALKGFLLTDGLEAPSRPGEMDQPVRELNVPSSTPSMQPQ